MRKPSLHSGEPLFLTAGEKNVADGRNTNEPTWGFDHAYDHDNQHNQPIPPRNLFEISPCEPEQKEQRGKT